jgi:hypothetical protein
MRILIIATVRTGGKRLSEWVSKELGYHWHHEPEEGGYVGGFDIVVKVLVSSILLTNLERFNRFDPRSWDKIITLKRNDTRKAAESFAHAQQYDLYHSKYYINNKWIEDNEYQIGEDDIFISKGNEVIDKIDFPCLKLTYEGVYETGKEMTMLKEYLGITEPKYEEMLNHKHKYRNHLL